MGVEGWRRHARAQAGLPLTGRQLAARAAPLPRVAGKWHYLLPVCGTIFGLQNAAGRAQCCVAHCSSAARPPAAFSRGTLMIRILIAAADLTCSTRTTCCPPLRLYLEKRGIHEVARLGAKGFVEP